MIKTINRITHPHCTIILNGEILNAFHYNQEQGNNVYSHHSHFISYEDNC